MSGDSDPRWVGRGVVRAIHADQVRQHGGSLGTRDEGLLDSALQRARNRWHYDAAADLAALAAAYGIGLAKNHPFVDGNKRTAFQTMHTFLGLNGFRIEAGEPAVVGIMVIRCPILGFSAGVIARRSTRSARASRLASIGLWAALPYRGTFGYLASMN